MYLRFLLSWSTIITEKAFFGSQKGAGWLGSGVYFLGVNFSYPKNLVWYLRGLLTNQKKKLCTFKKKQLTFYGLKNYRSI